MGSTTRSTVISEEMTQVIAQAVAQALIAAQVNLTAPATEEPKKAARKGASKTRTTSKGKKAAPVTLKPLSKGEIAALRKSGAEWVKGLTVWQLQGRRPANAVATGKVVPASVLAKHGYCRPTDHVKGLVMGACGECDRCKAKASVPTGKGWSDCGRSGK